MTNYPLILLDSGFEPSCTGIPTKGNFDLNPCCGFDRSYLKTRSMTIGGIYTIKRTSYTSSKSNWKRAQKLNEI